MTAARNVHCAAAVWQRPSPGWTSTASAVELTVRLMFRNVRASAAPRSHCAPAGPAPSVGRVTPRASVPLQPGLPESIAGEPTAGTANPLVAVGSPKAVSSAELPLMSLGSVRPHEVSEARFHPSE